MWGNRTAVVPGSKARTIPDRGPFAHTRNPLYVGLIILDVAIGLLWPSVWALALVPIGVVALTWGAILPESTTCTTSSPQSTTPTPNASADGFDHPRHDPDGPTGDSGNFVAPPRRGTHPYPRTRTAEPIEQLCTQVRHTRVVSPPWHRPTLGKSHRHDRSRTCPSRHNTPANNDYPSRHENVVNFDGMILMHSPPNASSAIQQSPRMGQGPKKKIRSPYAPPTRYEQPIKLNQEPTSDLQHPSSTSAVPAHAGVVRPAGTG